MLNRDFLIAPEVVHTEFAVLDSHTLLHSMYILNYHDMHTSMSPWLEETYQALSVEERHQHKLIHGYLMEGVNILAMEHQHSFEQLLDALDQVDPIKLRDQVFSWMQEREDFPGVEALLNDVELLVSFTAKVLEEKQKEKTDIEENEQDWREIYPLLNQPDQLKTLISTHLRTLWERYYRLEWEKTRPMLEASVEAFNKLDSTNKSALDVIQMVTGRDLREAFSKFLEGKTKLTFIPSPHIGVFVGLHHISQDDNAIGIFYGARLPKESKADSLATNALNRSALLVQLNALADDTRLQILKLLQERGELCAQDIMNELDLSQSSASRHLRQLAASNYIVERRRDVAKCYQLSVDHIEETISAIRIYMGLD